MIKKKNSLTGEKASLEGRCQELKESNEKLNEKLNNLEQQIVINLPRYKIIEI